MKQNIAILMLLSGASAMQLRSLQEGLVAEEIAEPVLEEIAEPVLEETTLESLDDEGQQGYLLNRAPKKCLKIEPPRCKYPVREPKYDRYADKCRKYDNGYG